MVVMDFDDTLHSNGISQSAIEAINKIHKQGKIIGIVSGSGLESIISKINNNLMNSIDFIGSSNGALITEDKKKYLLVSEEKVAILGKLKDEFIKYSKFGKFVDTKYSIGLITKDNKLRNELKVIINSYNGVFCSEWNNGVSAVLITKYEALEKFCKYKEINPVVLAIGDSENDIPLFEFASKTKGKACLVGNSKIENNLINYKSKFKFGDGVADCIQN